MPWSSCTTWSPGFRSERNDPMCTRRRGLAQELGEATGVARDAGPPEADGVAGGPHAHRAVLPGELIDPRPQDVRWREHVHGDAVSGELVAALLRLCLERVVCELELHRVLEDDRPPLAEMVEQRCAGSERRRERVRPGRV